MDGQPGNDACNHHGARARPPDRAGYCSPSGKFYDLIKGQDQQPPYDKLHLKPAFKDPKSGAISCDYPKAVTKPAVRKQSRTVTQHQRPAATSHHQTPPPHKAKVKSKPKPKPVKPKKAPVATPAAPTTIEAPPDNTATGYCQLDPNLGQIIKDGCKQYPNAFYCLHGQFLTLVKGEPSWHKQYAGATPAPANQKCPKK